MKIWYNRINESRRTMIEVDATEVWIGRDSSNTVVLPSPLVSRRHAVVRMLDDGRLQLENLGLNSCLVGDEEVLGGQSVIFTPGTKVRIWPFTLTFEAEKAVAVSRQELESHLRSLIADLELKIHRKLLERLDLYEFENRRTNDPESIILLENNIEDICRELRVFGPENEPILEEITGLVLRDYLVNSLIMESGSQSWHEMGLSANEFDIPATLVPEREAELAGILNFIRERLRLSECRDTTEQVQRIEDRFNEAFQLVRPHLHGELRKYLILRTLKKDLKDTIFGFGPLQDLLRADSITEIMVVGKDQIYVERNGVIEKSGRRFISDKVTEAIIERIVAQVGRRIDKSQPLVDARLPDGSRVNAIIPPLAVKGPCLTIRKFPVQRMTMDDLIELGTITKAAATFLRAAVIDRKNILVSGGTGAGKTTLLNVLSSFIPFKERIITIEDTVELRLHQEHVVTLEAKPPNVEGQGAYTIRDLVRNALRMRPDRIIVGECRGPEALDMIQAMNTGHDGSLTTLHANTAREVIERLEVLILMAADLPIYSIHRQIASAIDLIVHITRLPGGRRVITEITEVVGVDPETKSVIMHDIFNFRNGRTLEPTGYLPTFIDSLVEKELLDLNFLYGEGYSSQVTDVMARASQGERRPSGEERRVRV